MARKMGLSGIHSMRKDELVRAVAKAARRKNGAASNSKPKRSASRNSRSPSAKATSSNNGSKQRRQASKTTGKRSNGSKTQNIQVLRKMRKASAEREQMKDLSHATTVAASAKRKSAKPRKRTRAPVLTPGKDRIVLLVRDPYWLQACWEVSRQSVLRAQAAMAEQWHLAKPVLRLYEVETGSTTSSAERVVREIPVHGGVKNWYIDIKDSPKSFRVELGYVAENGRFHGLVRSNTVSTPSPGSSDAIDENWTDIAENYEKIYAMSGGYSEEEPGGDLQEMFEERLRRPMARPSAAQFGSGAEQALRRNRDFDFHVDAELIVYGSSKPDAHVTLAGDPVRLRPDGSFTVRLSMPDRRQVLPVVAHSRDGVEERTVVLAVERN
jgi:hypothetical protein